MPHATTAAITIRLATTADVPVLTQLARETYAAAFGASMTADDLAAELAIYLSAEKIEGYITKDVVLVAEYKGRMVGFTHLSANRLPVETPSAENAQLRRLYVHADFQSRGIGALLMETALAQPLLRAARYVYLEVWSRNMGAQRFYQRYGFVKIGETPYITPSGAIGDPEYIMIRRQF